MVLDNIQLRYETAMMDSVATKVWGDGDNHFFFVFGNFMRVSRGKQFFSRENVK